MQLELFYSFLRVFMYTCLWFVDRSFCNRILLYLTSSQSDPHFCDNRKHVLFKKGFFFLYGISFCIFHQISERASCLQQKLTCHVVSKIILIACTVSQMTKVTFPPPFFSFCLVILPASSIDESTNCGGRVQLTIDLAFILTCLLFSGMHQPNH